MLLITFIQEYADCYRGILSDSEKPDGYICDILYPKRYPITYRGEKVTFEGVFKLKYTFDDGYFSPSLIVNRKQVRLHIAQTLLTEPVYPYARLYLCRFNEQRKYAVPLKKAQWDLKAKQLFVSAQTCKVQFDISQTLEDNFFKPDDEEEEIDLWGEDEE